MTLPSILDVPLKRCRDCGEWWPNDSEFYHPSGRTYRSVCKACHNEEAQRRYRARKTN